MRRISVRARRASVVSLLVFLCLSVNATVKLQPLFTDNMVLQQQTDAPIWGTASPGANVSVVTSWNKKKYTATAGADGRWKVSVKTPKAGGPYTMTIDDGTPVTLKNVMIGEVWICSGQSNMEMPVNGWGKVVNYEAEVANAKRPNIRLLTVEKAIEPRPVDGFKASGGGWQECSPSTIPPFSAAAYFFGRELNDKLNVPIGLIHTSWGGTPAEAWTSREVLREIPDFTEEADRVANSSADKEQCEREYREATAKWQEGIDASNDAASTLPAVYSQLAFDDKAWSGAQVPSYLRGGVFDSFDGTVWYRRVVEIPESMAGQPLKLCLGCIDDDDITYYNGVEVGRTNGYAKTREYDVPAGMAKAGKAVILVRLFNSGGLLGITGYNDKACEIKAADGTTLTLNGTWNVLAGRTLADFPARPRNPQNDPNSCTVLFNGMINPLVPYAFKGAIWYQGESNAGDAWQYRDLLSMMIRDWRERWNSDFPFYIVQLANYQQPSTTPGESTWAELRESQHAVAKILPNCGIACAIDIGEANDIHPKNKQEVGRRLALLALGNDYGQKVVSSGPVYSHFVVENDKIRVFFDNAAKGLQTSDGQAVKGFAIAGADHRYHEAAATIDGNSVVVSAKEVRRPVAVRYAWANNPVCNLANTELLPAYPFRTDSWLGITAPSKGR